MDRPTIYYDSSSGKLVAGLVWHAHWGNFEDYLSAPGKEGMVYGEATSREVVTELHQCSVSKGHITGLYWSEVTIDLLSGPRLGDFVPQWNHGHDVISEPFAARLRSSGLQGFKIRAAVKIGCNQTRLKKPKLFLLDVVGDGGRCHRFKVRNGTNECPCCRAEARRLVPSAGESRGVVRDATISCLFRRRRLGRPEKRLSVRRFSDRSDRGRKGLERLRFVRRRRRWWRSIR